MIIQRLGSCEKYVFYMMFICDDIIVKAARDIVTGDICFDAEDIRACGFATEEEFLATDNALDVINGLRGDSGGRVLLGDESVFSKIGEAMS